MERCPKRWLSSGMWTKADLLEKLKAHAAERQGKREAMRTPKTEQAAVF